MKKLELGQFLQDAINADFFKPDKDGVQAIDAVLDPGKSSLVVITGDNATGKSFLRRWISALLRRKDIECMHLSQEGRSQGGIERAFLYGDENYESTGFISSQGVTKGIYNSQRREKQHVIYWDEPDIGLSEESAAGAGALICDFALNMPELAFAAIVSSHSRALVKALAMARPWHIRLGGCPDMKTWLNREIVPQSLEVLKEKQRTTFRRIQDVFNFKKDEK